MRFLMVATAAFLGVSGLAAQAPATSPLQAELTSGFLRRVDEAARRVDGVVGWIVKDLTSGEVISARLEHQPFPTASTIKLSILYELLKQADSGAVDLDTLVRLDRRQVVQGSGVLRHLTTPAISLRDLSALMMILSDNTATNVVIDAVGMDRVNARMTAMGLGDIRLRRKMMDAVAVRRGDENIATPSSLATIAERLWSGDGLSAGSKATAHRILREVSGQVRSAVPSAVPVYAKTGTLTGVRAEAAVVEVQGRPFSLAVMTTYLATDEDAIRAMREIAATAYSYFDRLAKGGAHGRR